MAANIRYLDRKTLVVRELVKCAIRGETVTYGGLGSMVNIPAQGPWKPLLDLIGRELTVLGLPDLTFLIINQGTGYPGQIGLEKAKSPTPRQKELARRTLGDIFDLFCPEAQAPFDF